MAINTKERIAFAARLSEEFCLEKDWQTVVEEACVLLEEKDAIEFGLNCVLHVFESWVLCFPKDFRVQNA